MIKLASDTFNNPYMDRILEDLAKMQEKNVVKTSGPDLYKGFRTEAGVYDYDFDDGSIWKVETIDGIQYLVKVVEDGDEDKVIRQTASKNNTVGYIGDSNFMNLFLCFYGRDDNLTADIEHNRSLKNEFGKVINRKIDSLVDRTLKSNRFKVAADTKTKLAERIRISAPANVMDIKETIDKFCIENMR